MRTILLLLSIFGSLGCSSNVDLTKDSRCRLGSYYNELPPKTTIVFGYEGHEEEEFDLADFIQKLKLQISRDFPEFNFDCAQFAFGVGVLSDNFIFNLSIADFSGNSDKLITVVARRRVGVFDCRYNNVPFEFNFKRER